MSSCFVKYTPVRKKRFTSSDTEIIVCSIICLNSFEENSKNGTSFAAGTSANFALAILLSWNLIFLLVGLIITFISFCSNSTSPEGVFERNPINLSQKIVVLPSSIISTGICVMKFTDESVAFIVSVPSFAIKSILESIERGLLFVMIS